MDACTTCDHILPVDRVWVWPENYRGNGFGEAIRKGLYSCFSGLRDVPDRVQLADGSLEDTWYFGIELPLHWKGLRVLKVRCGNRVNHHDKQDPYAVSCKDNHHRDKEGRAHYTFGFYWSDAAYITSPDEDKTLWRCGAYIMGGELLEEFSSNRFTGILIVNGAG